MNRTLDPRGYHVREGLIITTCPHCNARVVHLAPARVTVDLPLNWEFGETFSRQHRCTFPNHVSDSNSHTATD